MALRDRAGGGFAARPFASAGRGPVTADGRDPNGVAGNTSRARVKGLTSGRATEDGPAG
jgi:hypothetical protein